MLALRSALSRGRPSLERNQARTLWTTASPSRRTPCADGLPVGDAVEMAQEIFNDFDSNVEVEMAVLMSFVIDYTWLLSVVPALQVIQKVIFIKGDDASPPDSLSQPGQHFHCRAIPPLYGSFHAKVGQHDRECSLNLIRRPGGLGGQ